MTNGIQNDRAKLSLDFDEDEDVQEPTREEIDRKIHEISEKSGFIGRAPAKSKEKKPGVSAPVLQETVTARRRRTRAKTGRTYPFNTKIKPETYDLICDMADASTEEEGRPVSLAEIIERAIDALQTKRAG